MATSPVSTSPIEQYCCCLVLKKAAIAVGQFTTVVSATICAAAFAVFFRDNGSEHGHFKMSSFSVASYCFLYLFVSRGLIRGIRDDRKDKVTLWSVMTIINIFLLIAGAIFAVYLCVSNEFAYSPTLSQCTLGVAAAMFVLAGILCYCCYIVMVLSRGMAGENFNGDNAMQNM